MGPRTVRMSIAVKAALFVAALFVVCVSALVVTNVFAERRLALSELQDRGRAMAVAAAKFAGSHTADAEAGVGAYLTELTAQPDVLSAYAARADGSLIAASGVPLDPATKGLSDLFVVRALETGAIVCVVADGALHVAMPIETGGVVRLVYSIETIQSRSHALLQRSVWFALLSLGVALPVTGLVISRAMRPVRKLTEASERVAARDFDITLDVNTGDELEMLANSFNDMVGEVRGSLTRVRTLAFMDQLTKLPNKTAFLERAKRAIGAAKTPGAVLLINLDRFKRLNDTFGEREGDRILATTASRLRGVAQRLSERYEHPDAQPPVVARLSGDEFAVLICGPAPTGAAKATARDLIDAVSEPLEIANQQISITARVGIARFPLDAADAEHLMRHANLALDAAKAEGGARYTFFEPEMTRRAVERVTLEHELRQAVANKEFVVHYQPKVDARSGAITGCEALVRWNRRGRLVAPGTFIEVAEESGLIAEIGDFVLDEACRAAARWVSQGLTGHVAVNVSAVQFEREDFSRRVMSALKSSGLSPEALELELTESVAMDEPERVAAQIEPLRAKGVRFAIDDFGTGYSSLASLTRLPFDVFKIDQSFVRRLEDDPNARVVIETILAMARALGYDTVAEGVETETHYAFLRLNGCTHAQGWLFGKPVPEDEFVALMNADTRQKPVPATAPRAVPEARQGAA